MSGARSVGLRLRPATPADLDALVALRNEAESVRFSKSGLRSREDLERDYLHNPRKSVYQVEGSDGTDIGFAILEDLGRGRFEISVALGRAYRGHRLACPLIMHVSAHAVSAHGARTVVATIAPDNIASVHGFEAAGYHFVATTEDDRFALYSWEPDESVRSGENLL